MGIHHSWQFETCSARDHSWTNKLLGCFGIQTFIVCIHAQLLQWHEQEGCKTPSQSIESISYANVGCKMECIKVALGETLLIQYLARNHLYPHNLEIFYNWICLQGIHVILGMKSLQCGGPRRAAEVHNTQHTPSRPTTNLSLQNHVHMGKMALTQSTSPVHITIEFLQRSILKCILLITMLSHDLLPRLRNATLVLSFAPNSFVYQPPTRSSMCSDGLLHSVWLRTFPVCTPIEHLRSLPCPLPVSVARIQRLNKLRHHPHTANDHILVKNPEWIGGRGSKQVAASICTTQL